MVLALNAELRSETARRLAFVALCLLAVAGLNQALRYPDSRAGCGSRRPPRSPVTTMIGVSLLLSGTRKGHGKQTSQLMLLIAVAGLCSLVQFPFPLPSTSAAWCLWEFCRPPHCRRWRTWLVRAAAWFCCCQSQDFIWRFVMLPDLPNRIYSAACRSRQRRRAIVAVPQVGGVGALDPLVRKR